MTDDTPTPPDDQVTEADASAHEGPNPRIIVDNTPYGTVRMFESADRLEACLREAAAVFKWQKAFELKPRQPSRSNEVIKHPRVRDVALAAADLLGKPIQSARVVDGTITLTPADLGLSEVEPPAESDAPKPSPPTPYSFWHVIDPGSGVREQLERIQKAEGSEVASWVVALLTGYPMAGNLFGRVVRDDESGAHPMSLIQGLSIATMLRSEFGRFEYDEQSRASWREQLRHEVAEDVEARGDGLVGLVDEAVKSARAAEYMNAEEVGKLVGAYHGRVKDYNAWLDGAKKDLQALHERYKIEIPAHDVVRLWNRRWVGHLVGRLAWGGAATIATVVGVDLILDAKERYLSPLADGGTVNWPATFMAITVLALLTTVFIWLLRILVRMYLSHVHLSNASLERQTLIKAFIGLKKGGYLNDEQEKLLLSQALRISQDGVVKEDALPLLQQLQLPPFRPSGQ